MEVPRVLQGGGGEGGEGVRGGRASKTKWTVSEFIEVKTCFLLLFVLQ